MCAQKRIGLIFRRAGYHLKSIGFHAILPLLIFDLLVPYMNYMEYRASGAGDSLYWSILQYTQWLMPLFSVWWVIFTLREYVEAEGYELLYVCKNKCKFWDALLLFGMMLLDEVLVFGAYSLFWMPSVFKEVLRIICISVFYFGAAYFLIFLTRSLTAPLMALLLYTIANTIWMNQKFPLYYTLQFLDGKQLSQTYLPLAGIGLILTGIGVLLNKRMSRYH